MIKEQESMKREEVFKQRHDILNAVKREFDAELVPAQIMCGGEPVSEDAVQNGNSDDPEILTIFIEDLPAQGVDVLGEFFFLPTHSDEDLQVFMNILTIDTEIEKERSNELLLAIVTLNSYIPVGAFGVDFARNNIVYRHSYEMPHPSKDKALQSAAELSMGVAVSVVKDFGYMLLEVNEGTRDAESIALYFTQE